MASAALLTRSLCSKRLWGTLAVARPLLAVRCASHHVTLRGLPFSSKEKDIEEFLQPIQPSSIEVVYSSRGRHSGKAIVTLDCEETMQEVLKKNNQYMGRWGVRIDVVCLEMRVGTALPD